MNGAEQSSRTRTMKNTSEEPRNWEEINQRLAWLGESERQIRTLRDQFEQKVAVLKQQWLEASQPATLERDRLEEEIERFYWAHRDEVLAGGRKSVELAFGRLGSRRSRSVVVDDTAAAQQWLAVHGLPRYLRVRTDLDREALRSVLLGGSGAGNEASAELMRCPGVHIRESEEFWYEVRRTGPEEAVPETVKEAEQARRKENEASVVEYLVSGGSGNGEARLRKASRVKKGQSQAGSRPSASEPAEAEVLSASQLVAC